MFQVLRSCLLVAVILAVFLLPMLWGFVSLLLFVLVQAGYYFYLYRLVLCIFALAQRAERVEREGQPVGRPPVPPDLPPDLSEYQDENGILIL